MKKEDENAESVLRKLDEQHNKYKFMEYNLTTKKARLKLHQFILDLHLLHGHYFLTFYKRAIQINFFLLLYENMSHIVVKERL